jgi:fatty-acid desaturase
LDAEMVERRKRKHLDVCLHNCHTRIGLGWYRVVSDTWMASISRGIDFAGLGGFGTTIGYHRALAHRAVKLNPILEQLLICCAVFNGSGAPSTWIANHRNHHANADTIEDVSSPRHGGFWWAHIRWLYQWRPSPMQKWCPDLIRPRYLTWKKVQVPLIIVSIGFGYFPFGWVGLFWMGAIRLVYCLHMQAFVNSLLQSLDFQTAWIPAKTYGGSVLSNLPRGVRTGMGITTRNRHRLASAAVGHRLISAGMPSGR